MPAQAGRSSQARQSARGSRTEIAGCPSLVVGFGDDLVRSQVIDQGGDDEPMVRSVRSPVEEDGRGLMLIAACAKDWGVQDRPSGGRCVWAELARVGV